MQAPNMMAAMQGVISAFNHESFLVEICKKAGLTRVVQGYVSEETQIDDPSYPVLKMPLCYIIFETADGGDLRDMLHRTGGVDIAVKFRLLHQVAVGLNQLHKNDIAHQDLKPSNVGIFEEGNEGAKILDLGRATSHQHPAIHDQYPLPGDPSYAPPEQYYEFSPNGFTDRRASCDLFQLGSLLSFLIAGISSGAGIFQHVPISMHPSNWKGGYEEVLPYIHEAFAKWLNDVSQSIPKWCQDDVLLFLKHACDPDPRRRGDPKARMQLSRPIGMDRFVSRLDNLVHRAEIVIRTNKATVS